MIQEFPQQDFAKESMFLPNGQIDNKNTIFFKIGYNDKFSSDPLVFSFREFDEFIFHPSIHPDELLKRKLTISKDMSKLFEMINEIKQIGNFIIHKNKWGFLLNLSSIRKIQDGGQLNKVWELILKNSFFLDCVRRYAYYIVDSDEKMSDFSIPSSIDEPEVGIKAPYQLFPHQIHEVTWMLRLEQKPILKIHRDHSYIPFFDTGLYFNPNITNEFITRDKLKSSEIFVNQGILASQVGSGKTVSLITLINLDPKLTLIIVPKTILLQWAEELRKFSPLKVYFLETENQKQALPTQPNIICKLMFRDCTIILTQRSVIANYNKNQYVKKFFYQNKFGRIIIDEIHELTFEMKQKQNLDVIKFFFLIYKKQHEFSVYQFYASMSTIQSQFLWGITGTPQNLKYNQENSSFAQLMKMDKIFTIQYSADLMQQFVKNNMRRNPNTAELPQLIKSQFGVRFGQLQNILYNAQIHNNQMQWAEELCSQMNELFRIDQNEDDALPIAVKKIQDKMSLEIQSIHFALATNQSLQSKQILQIRLNNLEAQDNFYQEVIKLISQEIFECYCCLMEKQGEEIVVPECFHNICSECFKCKGQTLIIVLELKQGHNQIYCPLCKELILQNQLIIHPSMRKKRESKLSLLIKHIKNLPVNEKAIVFTQFNELRNHMYLFQIKFTFRCKQLQQNNINFIILQGEPSEINISLLKFKLNEEFKVLLMSVEQAASGLNITEANHIIFAHPLFGYDYERTIMTYNQCIGRSYRIGQTKPVTATIFFIERSIEEGQLNKFYANIQY